LIAAVVIASLGAAGLAVAFVRLERARTKAEELSAELRAVRSALDRAEDRLNASGLPAGAPGDTNHGDGTGGALRAPGSDRWEGASVEDAGGSCGSSEMRTRRDYEQCSRACGARPDPKDCERACDRSRVRSMKDGCFATHGCRSFIVTGCEALDICVKAHDDKEFCTDDANAAIASGCWRDLARTCVESDSWPKVGCAHSVMRSEVDLAACVARCDADSLVIDANDLGCRSRCAYWWENAVDNRCVEPSQACGVATVNSCDLLKKCFADASGICAANAELSRRLGCWQGSTACR
jgi:type II secretory pathway pseudopilin PulG